MWSCCEFGFLEMELEILIICWLGVQRNNNNNNNNNEINNNKWSDF